MLLAFYLQRRPTVGGRNGAVAAGALGYLALLFASTAEQSRLLYPLGFLATQLATAIVIVAALRPGAVARLLSVRPLEWLGVRSYGVYLWHWPLVVLLRPRIDVGWSPGTAAVITIGLAILLGHLSYRLIERPLLTPARRPHPAPTLLRLQWAIGGVAAVGLLTLLADVPKTDPIVSSLRAGQQVVSHQTPVPVAPPAAETTTTIAPAVAVAPPAPVAAPPPVVSAIGDSVMLGAAPRLQGRLNGGVIDARVGRQFVEGIAVAKRLHDEGRLGQVVVIHLGTNGPPHPQDIDGLMAQLAGVPRVLLVTSRMPRTWEGATNDALRAAIARHPTAVLVDWFALSNGHPEWFLSDGVHLRPPGAQAFADLIGGAIVPPPPPPPPPPTTTASDARIPPGRRLIGWRGVAHAQ
jgi:hypothetical protein